ncbi:hypothetical protein Taro_000129 [Colocasia esculenta]|uniref:Uncharacterized protein n=1 Tax=Colocasia esculenta TaxID=4460 RepID=A0A843TDX9_COLES|nr:hypothetical protein [Colocasia esculenta]
MIWELWKGRCVVRYDAKKIQAGDIIRSIKLNICFSLNKTTFSSAPTPVDQQILQNYGFAPHFSYKQLKLVHWIPPIENFCLNVDGASKGNPGNCGGGGCIRDTVMFVLPLLISTCLIAKTRALSDGLRLDFTFLLSTQILYPLLTHSDIASVSLGMLTGSGEL